MTYPRYNKKVEQDPRDAGRSDPQYPYIRGEVDECGRELISYANSNDRGKEFVLDFGHSGSFTINENAPDDKKGLTNVLSHEKREYNTGGSSTNTDGHIDVGSLLGASMRINARDFGKSLDGTIYSGSTGPKIESNECGGLHHCGPSSTGTYTDGKIKTTYSSGDISVHHEGAHTTSVVGNKYEGIESGDYGVHVQGGSMDTQIDSGQYRVKTVGDNLILDSSVRIIFRVGTSVITMEPSKITIQASDIEFIKA